VRPAKLRFPGREEGRSKKRTGRDFIRAGEIHGRAAERVGCEGVAVTNGRGPSVGAGGSCFRPCFGFGSLHSREKTRPRGNVVSSTFGPKRADDTGTVVSGDASSPGLLLQLRMLFRDALASTGILVAASSRPPPGPVGGGTVARDRAQPSHPTHDPEETKLQSKEPRGMGHRGCAARLFPATLSAGCRLRREYLLLVVVFGATAASAARAGGTLLFRTQDPGHRVD